MELNLIETLITQGFAVAQNVFSQAELATVSEFTNNKISHWLAGEINDPDYWHFFSDEHQQEILYRIHNLETKDDCITQLISLSQFKSLVESISGPDARPCAFALTIKLPNVGASVPWHRDRVECDPATVYNFSIYLDQSTPENGCLASLPGSHQFKSEYEVSSERPDGAINITAQPGDVIIHDVRTIHGSSSSLSPLLRRAIVIEFQPKDFPGFDDNT